VHYTKGRGFYEQYKGASGFDGSFFEFLESYGLHEGDVVRQRWLDNDFYGVIAGLHFFDPSEKFALQLSGALNRYDGDHFGRITWSEAGNVNGLPDYYRNDANKIDRSAFLKFKYQFTSDLSGMLDLQLRGVRYQFAGSDIEGNPFPREVKHHFFNPKAGLAWSADQKNNLYAYVGIAHREPNRDDYITSSAENPPRTETLFNGELGWGYKNKSLKVGLNGYYMYYDDQLILTGRINDVGEYARQNIDKSSRIGAEAVVKWEQQKWDAGASATLSRNRVEAFDEYVDDWDNGGQIVLKHENTPLAFSPGFVCKASVGYYMIKSDVQEFRLGVQIKYINDQYIDNTGNSASVLESYTTTDLRISYGRSLGKSRVEAQILIRNVFDQSYSSNAWIYRFQSAGYDPRPDDPYAELEGGDRYHLQGLFPQAGRNFLAGVTLSF
jgi:iron complex outermembrane receptor protein